MTTLPRVVAPVCVRRAGHYDSQLLGRHVEGKFSATASAVAGVRDFARDTLNGWGLAKLAGLVSDAMLIADELAANVAAAVPDTDFVLALDYLGSRLRIATVQDGMVVVPAGNSMPADDAEHGRGLPICSALAAPGTLLAHNDEAKGSVECYLEIPAAA